MHIMWTVSMPCGFMCWPGWVWINELLSCFTKHILLPHFELKSKMTNWHLIMPVSVHVSIKIQRLRTINCKCAVYHWHTDYTYWHFFFFNSNVWVYLCYWVQSRICKTLPSFFWLVQRCKGCRRIPGSNAGGGRMLLKQEMGGLKSQSWLRSTSRSLQWCQSISLLSLSSGSVPASIRDAEDGMSRS